MIKLAFTQWVKTKIHYNSFNYKMVSIKPTSYITDMGLVIML
jgi:hypothetical protein